MQSKNWYSHSQVQGDIDNLVINVKLIIIKCDKSLVDKSDRIYIISLPWTQDGSLPVQVPFP